GAEINADNNFALSHDVLLCLNLSSSPIGVGCSFVHSGPAFAGGVASRSKGRASQGDWIR
ncbi:MAG: hypothetical protein QGF59_14155, partial [Pirellulaceae bacterium]|nr:hypothetical protein [Pirellulaceae bacterium]